MYLIDVFGRNEKSFDEVMDSYEEAKRWLEEKGIRVNPTRFEKNRKLIQKVGSANTEEDFRILWANAELHDICEIHQRLATIDSARLTETLRKSVTGHELLSEERNDGGSVHGRNFTFELYTASRIARCGYEVTFDTDSDINFLEDGRLIHVECKRVVSENRLDALIVEAMHQIDKRCEDSPTDRGIVAVSLSKLVSKALNIEAKGTYGDLAEMQKVMRVLIGKWSQLIKLRYSALSVQTIGVILHYKMPLRDSKTGGTAFLNRFSMISFDNSAENKVLEATFSSRMRESVEGVN